MPGKANSLDEIANDLALWLDQTSTEIALAFAPNRAPFSANITEEQKLEYYKNKFFNPDGTPNPQGREQELQRMGISGFTQVYKALIKRFPELRVPTPEPIEVPEQWPQPGPVPPGGPPAPPGAPPGLPGGLPPGSGGGAPPSPGPPMPAGPPAVGIPPRAPMLPPRR